MALMGEKKKPLAVLNDGYAFERTARVAITEWTIGRSSQRRLESLNAIESAQSPNCVQAKRRHADDLAHKTGEKEHYSGPLLVQDYANLLGYAMTIRKVVAKRGAGGDKSRGSSLYTEQMSRSRLLISLLSIYQPLLVAVCQRTIRSWFSAPGLSV